MAAITLRNVKGSPLTNQEVDDNFNNINVQLNAALPAATYTAADVLTKLKTVDGSGSGLDADLLDGYSADQANTAGGNTVVVRNSTGDIYVSTLNSTGVSTTNITTTNLTVNGSLIGTLTGNASNVNGTVQVNNGGTGGTDQASGRTGLGLGTIATQNANAVNITGGAITLSSATPLAISSGGTGSITAQTARTNLGLSIGTDVQPYSNELAGIAAAQTNGIYVRYGSAQVTQRTIVSTTSALVVTNGNGVAGNPSIAIDANAGLSIGSLGVSTSASIGTTLTVGSSVTLPSITKSGSSGTGDIGQDANRFGTIYGTATSAKYADLAEKYLADDEYETGTVMCVGGEKEVTQTTFGDLAIGAVSENPAFKMNDDLVGGTYIALKGRVPVKVFGPITKGKSITAYNNGSAIECEHHHGTAFGIALETNLEEGIKLVECVIL